MEGFKDVTHDDESALVDAIVKEPVSIAIEADQSAFQFYRNGVLVCFYRAGCGRTLCFVFVSSRELVALAWITVSWLWDTDLRADKITGR